MNNKILEKAKKILSERKFKAELNARENLEIAMDIQGFASIYSEYKSEMINIAKKEALNEPYSSKRLMELEKDIIARLNKYGLSLLDLKPNYTCIKCNDSGFVAGGKICSCLTQEMGKVMLSEQKISLSSFKDANFSIFENENYIRKVYGKMENWCNTNSNKSIILSGKTGVGKTFLLESMANCLLENGIFITYTTAFSLNQDFLKYNIQKDASKYELLSKYLDCDVLFVDDLGTEKIHPNITKEMLFLLINERNRNNKPFVISTNLTAEEINERYDERILSRIIGSSIFLEVEGKDLRMK